MGSNKESASTGSPSIINTAIDCVKDVKSMKRILKDLSINFLVDKAMAKVEIILDEDVYSEKDLEIFDTTIYDLIKHKYPKALSQSDYQNILERFLTKRKVLLPGDYIVKIAPSTFMEILKQDNTESRTNFYMIRIIGKDKEQHIKRILKTLQDNVKKKQTEGSKIFKNNGRRSETNDRTIENIFLSNKKEIINYIDYWKESEEIYQQIFIPYKTGLIFCGPPGTGKTTFACALGNYLNFNVYFLSPEEIIEKDYYYPRGSKDKGIVLIIDEIDNWIDADHSISKGYGKNKVQESAKLDLRTFREYIDNIPDKTVVIATTNHYEKQKDGSLEFKKLDDSLLRAGRFDKHFEFANITEKVAKEMVSYHGVGLSVLDGFPDKSNINPAALEKIVIEEKLKMAGVDRIVVPE